MEKGEKLGAGQGHRSVRGAGGKQDLKFQNLAFALLQGTHRMVYLRWHHPLWLDRGVLGCVRVTLVTPGLRNGRHCWGMMLSGGGCVIREASSPVMANL